MHRARRLSRRITATGDCAAWRAGFGQLDRTLARGAHGIPVTLNLLVPTSRASSLRRLGERNPFFVVFGTKGAKVVAYAHGDRTKPLAAVVASVLGSSPVCTKGAARVCSLTLSLKATGKDDFVITTYDQSPSGGVIPATAKQLAAGLEVKKIGPKGKTFTAVVGGVVPARRFTSRKVQSQASTRRRFRRMLWLAT